MLNSVCSGNKNSNRDTIQKEVTQKKLPDTLEFKSGIRSILHDSKGNYWLGSDQEGVCKYDGQKFTYYTPENGFCGKQVIDIQEDELGHIWFGTSSGLCCFDGIKFYSNDRGLLTHVLRNEVQAEWSSNRTDLWFSGKKINELIRVTKDGIHTVNYPFQIPVMGKPNNYGITGFSKSKQEGLWIAHYPGVSYYDGKKLELINDSTMHYDGITKYMHVRSILEDSKGRLWIGNNGIGVLLKEGNAIIHFSEKHHLFKGDIFGVKSPAGTLMHVFAIYEDSKGHIWFGDRDTGAWRFDGKEIKNFVLDAALNSPHIWNIMEDKSGNLLFASGVRGVYKFNGNGFERFF